MAANDEGRELFDFGLDDLLGKSNDKPKQDTEKKEQPSAASEGSLLNSGNEAITSYLLVNALLNLLLAKGIIYQHEVNALIAELYVEYRKHKRSGNDDNNS